MAAQAITLVPFIVASGLMAPLWVTIALVAAWVAAAIILALLARRRPIATPLVPLASLAMWWLALTAGERLLGWTAVHALPSQGQTFVVPGWHLTTAVLATGLLGVIASINPSVRVAWIDVLRAIQSP